MNLIVFDLETTCWDGQPLARQRETIEIGALKINQLGEITSSFTAIIKPYLNSTLSIYCKKLTTISQKEIDKANSFPEVINTFIDWIEEDYNLIAWGKFDEHILLDDMALHDIDNRWLINYINAKRQYQIIKNLNSPIGFRKAIFREFGEFEGTEHRAYSDAFNLSKLVIKYFNEW